MPHSQILAHLLIWWWVQECRGIPASRIQHATGCQEYRPHPRYLKKWLQFLSAPDDIRQDHAKGHLALQGCQDIPTSMCSFAIFGTTAQAENFVWVQLCRWDQHTYDEQIQRHQESPTPRLFELYNSSLDREKKETTHQIVGKLPTITDHHPEIFTNNLYWCWYWIYVVVE